MIWKQRAKQLFLKCDIFSTSQFLRFNEQPEYRTFTGAFCSIITVVSFCTLFMNIMISTFAKTEIVWSLSTVDAGLDEFNIVADITGKNKFMFAVSVLGYDLNTNDSRIFDVDFMFGTVSNTKYLPQEYLKLEPCTLDHWNINEEFAGMYKRMNFQKMLCPKIGLSIPIQGKFTSNLFKYAEIRLVKCTASANKTCASESELQNKTFYFNVFMVNTLINPESSEYVSYYLEDRNYVQFTTEFTTLVNIFISNYQITTDESISPFKQERQEEGAIANNLGQVIPRQSDGRNFANMILRRASTKIQVNRGFKKVDQTLSYIGGLFGFALILLLFMKEYTQYSFQIEASSYLYYQDHQKPTHAQKFNFLIFIGYIGYLFLGIFGFEPNWQTMREIDDSREEIQKQFDVRFLFQRINFIEKALNHLFSDSQSKFLHLLRKPTLKEASQMRENYLFKDSILEKSLKINRQGTQNPLENSEDHIRVSNQIFPTFQSHEANEDRVEKDAEDKDVVSKLRGHFKLLRKDTIKGDHTSQKIIEDLDPYIIKIFEMQNGEEVLSDSAEHNSGRKSGREAREGYFPKRRMEVADMANQNTRQIKDDSNEDSREKGNNIREQFEFVN